MADAIVRLKVDSQEYNNKIRRASEGLQHFEHECRRVGGTLEYVEKEDLAFVKALGSMQTAATNSRQKMMEFTNAINDLSIQYKGLTAAEKQSPYGKALSASIDQLKARAGELKDRIADTNAELKNLASDTAFTDGIGMMTRTIGACSAAMVAWGGKSQTMDEMIKSLAKVQTTVGAVEALTKAFQKQNLVLLKNPYVAAAAGLVAMTTAMIKLIQKSQELDHVTKTINEVQAKGRENSAQEITRIEQLTNILHDNTRSLDERKTALTAIQNLVPDYHGALTKEGTLINDNTDSISAYVTELQRAATAQAAFDKMVELQKQKLNKQVELKKANKNLETAKARNTTAQGQVVYAGTEMTQVYTQQDVSSQERAVKNVESEIRAIDQEITALQDLTNAATIAGKAVENVNKGGKSKTTTPDYLKNNLFSTAMFGGTPTEIQQLLSQQKILSNALANPGDFASSDAYQEVAAVLADINEQVEMWKQGLAFVCKETEDINAEQSKGVKTSGIVTDNAKATTDAWQNAAIALQAAASAMNAIDDPSAKIAGTLAQAVASIMLGFAQASASPATGAAGVFGWIAATLSGLATAISVVSTIKSVTNGYAEGGMVLPNGSPYGGDNIVARLNAGEGVLTAKGIETAEQLRGKAEIAVAGGTLSTRIKGGDILIALDNTNRSRGGSRGTYAYSK